MIAKQSAHELYRYEPETGFLYWKSRPREHFRTERGWRVFCSRFEGKVAATNNGQGYYLAYLNGKQRLVHRIIWEMHYGPVPEGMDLDHINGIRNDNRIENLRIATRAENLWNKLGKEGGMKGVYRDKRRKKRPWQARINVNGVTFALGAYKTQEEAHQAYVVAAAKYHKAFARTS